MAFPDRQDMEPVDIDKVFLTPIVRRALKDDHAEISEFSCQTIQGGFEANSQVIRYRGTARIGDQTKPWSLILKSIAYSPENDEPGGIQYWKREALGYQSGLIENLPGGVTAPRCYAVTERPGKGVWIWLEEVQDEVGAKWPLEQYREAARLLGQMNGAYLAGTPLPEKPWLPKDWVFQYTEKAAPQVEFIRDYPDDPLVKKMYTGITRWLILTVWEERRRFFKILDGMPQVFCHQDAFKRNLFARRGQLVAIDWTYMGRAPLGTELVALVGGTIALFELPPDQVETLDRITFEGYLDGLRSTGWHGSPRDIRMAFCLSLTLRYVFGANIGELFAYMRDPNMKEWIESNAGHSTQELQELNIAVTHYYTARLMEGLRLLGILPAIGMALRGIARSLRKWR